VSPLTFSAPRTDVRAQLDDPRRELLLVRLGRNGEPAPFEFLATTGALPSSRRAYPPVPVTAVPRAARPSPFLDLAELYRAAYPGRRQAVVHDATCEPRDVAHAHELAGVELRAYEMTEPERHVVGGHALCHDLRDDGTMSTLLLEAAGLAPAPAPGTRFRTGPVAGLDHSVVF
jgi:hypothetical protein